MLIKNKYKQELKDFMKRQNEEVQDDPDKSLDLFAQKMEDMQYEYLKSITITIPSGMIIITTPSGVGTNAQPIILNNVIS